MPRKLTRKQPETLIAIALYERRFGRAPAANALASILAIDPQTATMRIGRLRQAGYLVEKDGTWFVNSSTVVTQPETARLLLAVSARCAEQPGGRIRRDELEALMDEVGIQFDTAGKFELTRMLLEGHYLATVAGWDGFFRTGPQIAEEIEYLTQLQRPT